jgi:hypothetical protein
LAYFVNGVRKTQGKNGDIQLIMPASLGCLTGNISPMPPCRSLPAEYQLARSIDLRQEPKLMLWLNLVGLGLLVLFGWLFLWLAEGLRSPTLAEPSISISLPSGIAAILGTVVAFVGVLVLHELVHGLCFWLITRARPRFGLQLAYAYASAPEWFIQRNPYLVVGLAPLILISLLGVALLPWLPGSLLLPWVFALAVNASGSVGDLYIIGWLLGRPASALVNDHGDCIRIYLPQAT